MDRDAATTIFETLSSGVRLDAFRLLVKAGPEGMVAGEIAAALGMAPTNLSFHLKAMSHAGLVTATREGRYQRYRADLTLMVSLVGYLTEECCGSRPEICGDFSERAICPTSAPSAKK